MMVLKVILLIELIIKVTSDGTCYFISVSSSIIIPDITPNT